MLVCALTALVLAPSGFAIHLSESSDRLVGLAGSELRRYLYLRTGELAPVVRSDGRKAGDQGVVLRLSKGTDASKEAYSLVRSQDGRRVVVESSSPIGLLYGAYELLEWYGVGFSLHGDTLPDGKRPLKAIHVDPGVRKPLFSLRGIQPFHDFPEGPDWWNGDEYKAVVGQLPKLRMNFIGLHTYPEPIAEPTVWIGLKEDVKPGGDVSFAYPASYQNTARGDWGYQAKKTSEFSFGAAGLFEKDWFGADVMDGLMPKPDTPDESILVFNRTGRMLREAFSEAKAYGIHTCVGTETPLTIPALVQERLRERGENPLSLEARRKVYEGIFKRIGASYPVDTYWMWTPENWTWSGNSPAELQRTLDDIEAANAAAKAVNAPFQLATCGWVLGPQSDRSYFDRVLPKSMPVACINRVVGNEPVDPAFDAIKGRDKWAIPWLEDDPGMTQPQLWAARMRRDASDALAYGCTGLMGIHWRTWSIAPNVLALSRAAWDQDWPEPQQDRVWRTLGGLLAFYGDNVIEGTSEPAIYRSVRYGLTGYDVRVPSGSYRVTLKFSEVAYDKPDVRVFDVSVDGRKVIEDLDIFAKVGKNRPFDLTVETQTDGQPIRVRFHPKKEYPCIAAIVVEGRGKEWKLNCAGPAMLGYDGDTVADMGLPEVFNFYLDWCSREFGEDSSLPQGPEIFKVFAQMDGRLPRVVDWVDGPGGLRPDSRPWKDVEPEFGFVGRLTFLRQRIKEVGGLSRYDAWLDSFRYLEKTAQLRCAWGEMLRGPSGPKAGENVVKSLGDAYRLLLRHVSTTGDLGTVANWEQHILPGLLKDVEQKTGSRPQLPKTYTGPLRTVLTTPRTVVSKGEPFRLTARALSGSPVKSVELVWRPLGRGPFVRVPMGNVDRSVFKSVLPLKEDVEVYVVTRNEGGEKHVWPPTAPALPHTVVVWP